MPESDLTSFEKIKIQMDYAIPLIRGLQEVLGKDAVNQALEQMIEKRTRALAAPGDKANFGMMKAGTQMFAEGGALDYEIVEEGEDAFDVNIHSCAYARMMADEDASDIGKLLICNFDYPAAAAIGMDLDRTQTKMEGAPYCDFRYRRRARNA